MEVSRLTIPPVILELVLLQFCMANKTAKNVEVPPQAKVHSLDAVHLLGVSMATCAIRTQSMQVASV